jgi:hypothetical protein
VLLTTTFSLEDAEQCFDDEQWAHSNDSANSLDDEEWTGQRDAVEYLNEEGLAESRDAAAGEEGAETAQRDFAFLPASGLDDCNK